SPPGLISCAAFSICVPSGHLFWVRHRVRCESVERGYCSDLLEELEGVQFVPVLLQTAVTDPPDVDRVQLDFGAARRAAHERAGVASAVREAAGESVAVLDDVVNLGAKVLKRGEEVSEDANRAVLAGCGEAVVVDVLLVQELAEGV